jgi:hypothetical protein
MIPLRCFALYWRGVKYCGFVEFWRELGEKKQKKWKFAKKLVENAKFFLSSTDFPSLMCWHAKPLQSKIPHCSHLLTLLTALTKKNIKFKWTTKHQQASTHSKIPSLVK